MSTGQAAIYILLAVAFNFHEYMASLAASGIKVWGYAGLRVSITSDFRFQQAPNLLHINTDSLKQLDKMYSQPMGKLFLN